MCDASFEPLVRGRAPSVARLLWGRRGERVQRARAEPPPDPESQDSVNEESPRRCPSTAGFYLQRALLCVVLGVICLAVIYKRRSLIRNGQDAFATAYYQYDPGLLGRSHTDFPAPSCCVGGACAGRNVTNQRVAVVSTLSSAEYLPLFLQLECTLRRSNPSVDLAVMVTPGVLEPAQRRLFNDLNVHILETKPLEFKNTYEPRYSRNWIKLRAFNFTQYDVLLMLDSDIVVPGDLSPLWTLPTPFAAVWDQQRWLGRHRATLRGINGGVLLLRPCPATAKHMLDLLNQYPKLRFTHGTAEQEFLAWYFRYTGMMLPLEYNVQVSASLVGNLTVGGRDPVVLHFTANKPWRGKEPGVLGHDFLCDAETLRRRSLSAGMHASSADKP